MKIQLSFAPATFNENAKNILTFSDVNKAYKMVNYLNDILNSDYLKNSVLVNVEDVFTLVEFIHDKINLYDYSLDLLNSIYIPFRKNYINPDKSFVMSQKEYTTFSLLYVLNEYKFRSTTV